MEAGPGPRRNPVMGDADGPPESSEGRSGNDLPVMPGPEKPPLHIAIEFVESLDSGRKSRRLRFYNLRFIGRGKNPLAHPSRQPLMPAEAACIIDVPIEAVALPDPGDRNYGAALCAGENPGVDPHLLREPTLHTVRYCVVQCG